MDVHPATFTPAGDGVCRMDNGDDWIYPGRGFSGVGDILGKEVPCLTPDVVMINHTTGYVLDEAHQRDVIALGERYGLPLPKFVRG